jgi:hypothetical protein
VTGVTCTPVETPVGRHTYPASTGFAVRSEGTSMRMFEAWAIWWDNQPERISDGTGKRGSTEKPTSTFTHLNERTLHDIGVSTLGFPVASH